MHVVRARARRQENPVDDDTGLDIDDGNRGRVAELLRNVEPAFCVREVAGLRIRRHRHRVDHRTGVRIEATNGMAATVGDPDRAIDRSMVSLTPEGHRADHDDAHETCKEGCWDTAESGHEVLLDPPQFGIHEEWIRWPEEWSKAIPAM